MRILRARWAAVVTRWQALWHAHARFDKLDRESREAFSHIREMAIAGSEQTELILRIWENMQNFTKSEADKAQSKIEKLEASVRDFTERLRWYEQRYEPIRYQKERLDQHRAKLAALAKDLQPEVNDGSTAAAAATEQPAQPDGGGSAPESSVSQSTGPDADGQAGSTDVGGQPHDGIAGTG